MVRNINILVRPNGTVVVTVRGPHEGKPRVCRFKVAPDAKGKLAQYVRAFIEKAEQAHTGGVGLVERQPQPEDHELD